MNQEYQTGQGNAEYHYDPQRLAKMREMRKQEGIKSFQEYGKWGAYFAALFVFCTYRNPSGIAYVLLMAGCLWLFRKVRGRRGGKMQLFYEISLILLSIGVCTTGSGTLRNLNFFAMMLLGASMCVHAYCEDKDWGIARHLLGVLRVLLMPIRHLNAPFADCFAYNGERRKGKTSRYTKSILLGILIAIPLLVVVLGLLSGADEVFEQGLNQVAAALILPERLLDLIRILVWFVLAFICFYTVLRFMPKEAEEMSAERAVRRHDPVTAVTFMSILGVVYVVFAVIQLVFLFGRHSLPAEFTYAEYAHRGFAQLVVVCLLNLVLITICGSFFRDHKILNLILVIVCLSTYVMIASSAVRMVMYIEEYNLTFLRLFVLWFLVVLALWLTFILMGIIRKHGNIFRKCLIAITVLYLAFSFLHPDYWIARINMAAAAGEELEDEYYVLGLSVDALPAIAKDPRLLEKKKNMDDSFDKKLSYDPRQLNLMELVMRRYY